jgi:hypothetical protein
MPRLSIIIAVKDGDSNVPALLDAVVGRDTHTEVIICSAGPAPAVGTRANLTVLPLAAETLIPSLWSAGVNHARGTAVALTTAQFVPRPDWLGRLHAADLKHWAGVGGAVDNDPNASPRNWAIFFLRYSAFAPPLRPGECDEIAADNAVYDRAAIMEHPDLLEEGFWEPSFHRRFRAAGRKLMLDPNLVVIHHGTVSARSFTRQRYLHGRAYGTERAERGSAARNLILLLLSPLVAPLLLTRVLLRMAKRPAYRGKLLPAFPWLVRFATAWAAGEAAGYVTALSRRGAVVQSKEYA